MSRTIEDVLTIAGNRPVFALVSILAAAKAIAFAARVGSYLDARLP